MELGLPAEFTITPSSNAVFTRLDYLVETLGLPISDRRERLDRWREQLGAGIALKPI